MTDMDITISFSNIVTPEIRDLFRVGKPKLCCQEWCIKNLFNGGQTKEVHCELLADHDGTHMSLTDDYAFMDGFGSPLWFKETAS